MWGTGSQAHPYDAGKGSTKGGDWQPQPHYSGKGGIASPQPGVKGGKKGEEGIFFGRLKCIQHGAKGDYGFIDCPAATEQFGRDVFIHSKEMGDLQPGDDLSFHVELHKDMPQAKRAVKAGLAGTTPDERFVGRIHTVKAERGLGFVHCERAFALFGRDVCILKDHFAGSRVGDTISFRIELFKDMPQAREIAVVSSTPPTGERYVGRIHTFNANRKLGFIHCDKAHSIWQRDVCIHQDHMAGAVEGDSVTFGIEVYRGMPQARDVVVGFESPPENAPDERRVPPERHLPGARYQGRIHTYLVEKGFGFIHCEKASRVWSCDVFIHKDYLNGAREGDEIAFGIEVVKGKPQARDVRLADGSSEPAAEQGDWVGSGNAKKKRKRNRQRERRQPTCDVPEEERTTFMLKKTPLSFVRSYLLDTLDALGFGGQYDFVYVPTNFETLDSLGFAVVNMTTNAAAMDAMAEFQSWDGWKSMENGDNVEVIWNVEQGLESHIARYRNSAIMHDSVPDECQPILFSNGSRIDFPEPTEALEPPRTGGPRADQEFELSEAEEQHEDIPEDDE